MPHFLEEMFHAQSIAVYGASGPMKMGTIQALALIGSGYPGRVYFIHPSQAEVLGERAYRRAVEVPGPVDLGLIVIPAAAVSEALADLGRKGVRYAVVTTAGFEEMATEDGRRLNRELKRAAREAGIRIVGPNCLGVVNAHLPLNTTTFPAKFSPGAVSIASHSGSYTTQIFPYLEDLEPGLGLRYVLSLGNEADVDLVDALDCFREDEQTRAICLYIEGLRRGPEFIKAARAASLTKPVIAHYVGGNAAGARAGASHTAALGLPEDLARGLFNQCGVIRAEGIEELFDFARVLSQAPPMAGPRVAIITNSGGPGATMAYTCEKGGLSLPEFGPALKEQLQKTMPATSSIVNPVDFTFDTDILRFRDVTRLVLGSDEVDAVLIFGLFGSGFFERRRETYARYFPKLEMDSMLPLILAMVREIARIPGQLHKPLVMGTLMTPMEDGFRAFVETGAPAYPSPERAARALAILHRYWKWRRKMEQAP